MPRNSDRGFCCGAGGARMWMEEKIGKRVNTNRTEEAIATGAETIAVGCPFCRVMLSDGVAEGSRRRARRAGPGGRRRPAAAQGSQERVSSHLRGSPPSVPRVSLAGAERAGTRRHDSIWWNERRTIWNTGAPCVAISRVPVALRRRESALP